MVKHPTGLPRWLVFQDVADRLGQPLRVQDHNIPQALVVAVVDNLPKVVHQLGKRGDLITIDVMMLTDLHKLLVANLRLIFREGENLIACGDPPGADQLAHHRQPRRLGSNTLPQCCNPPSGEIVDLILPSQQPGDRLIKVRVIQLRATLIAVGRDHQYAGLPAHSQPDPAEPPFHLVLLMALPRVPHHHV